MLDVNYFDELRIGLATADQIRMWSNGEVKKPETINYRTLKPEKDGLFDERIFGPTKDWECYCGKYKRVRFKGIICERCGVEATRAKYAEDLENRLAELESKGEKAASLNRARKDTERQVKELEARRERDTALLEQTWNTFRSLAPRQLVDNEIIWRELRDRFGDYFRGGMGAEAVKELLHGLNLREEEESLKETVRSGKGQRKARAIKRLKVISPFTAEGGKNSPMGMVLDSVPVIPPDLRPMVQLDGGRFATSDLNDLYRRVINRNNRLKRLLDLGAPEIIVNNEKRMLQEAVDALFDNGRRGR